MRFRLSTKLRFAVVIAAMTTMVVASRADSLDYLLRQRSREYIGGAIVYALPDARHREDEECMRGYYLSVEPSQAVAIYDECAKRRDRALEAERMRAVRKLAFPPIPPH